MFKLPHTIPFSAEHLLSQGYIKEEVVAEYFPTDPYIVDRQFAWAVYMSRQSEDAKAYFHMALDAT